MPHKNKEELYAYQIKRWINRKIDSINRMGGQCADCGLKHEDSHYSVFEFHHLDPSEKDFSWNKLRLQNIDKINAELDKCVMLCANCHRMRHALERLSG